MDIYYPIIVAQASRDYCMSVDEVNKIYIKVHADKIKFYEQLEKYIEERRAL